MVIRKYASSDCGEIAKLFYNTIHSVNIKDYTKEQVHVWANGNPDLKKWDRTLLSHYTLVAVEEDIIVGFGDIDDTGYLDRLFIHKDYQRKGVATAICDKLEQIIVGTITTRASITAKPFFEQRGYKVVQEQQVEREGVSLTNYVMKKY
ncbi:MAG: GNAT family N-acetyltransferase [Candidatus Fimivivens sp.]